MFSIFYSNPPLEKVEPNSKLLEKVGQNLTQPFLNVDWDKKVKFLTQPFLKVDELLYMWPC